MIFVCFSSSLHSTRVASYNGHKEVVETLLSSGSNAINTPDGYGDRTPLQVCSYRSANGDSTVDLGPTVKLLLSAAAAAESDLSFSKQMANSGANRVFEDGKVSSELQHLLHAYESSFAGHIIEKRGCPCVASWPGIYGMFFPRHCFFCLF